MANTRYDFGPLSAIFPASNFPQLLKNAQNHMVLAFDATTSETCYWQAKAPQGLTGTMNAIITYAMASATSGGVAFDVAIEAITPGDALDTDAAASFDTVNAGNDAAVPGTAGYQETVTITITNADSIAAGDYFRLSLARDVADGNDTATGDCYVFSVEFRDAV